MQVVFDLDGVLLDSESDLAWLERALDDTLAAFDLPRTAENRRQLFPGRLDAFREAAAEFGVDAAALWRVRDDRYTAEKLAAIERGALRPFDDVEALYDLRDPPVGAGDLGRRLHVLSNSPGEVVETFVATYGYSDLFDVTVGRGHDLADLADLKPSTEPYDRLRTRIDAVADDARGTRESGDGGDRTFVYVGDDESDREFARRAGMDYLHVDREGEDPDGCRSLRAVRDRLLEA